MRWIAIVAFALTVGAQERVVTFGTQRNVEFAFEGKVVTGAPYSAQAVTETTQVLSDGNRISRKLSSFLARDSQGRTRREQSLKGMEPWVTPEAAPFVVINDPVAGARYMLESNLKIAIKTPVNSGQMQERREAERRMKQVARSKEGAGGNGMIIASEPKTATSSESLGTRTIEGVVAEGKRVTETIPAGRLGNEKPIEIVNETWYSPELQTVVMSKHNDPRSGDVTYTLTNISRAEPDASMFTVPQDYKIKDEQSLKVRE